MGRATPETVCSPCRWGWASERPASRETVGRRARFGSAAWCATIAIASTATIPPATWTASSGSPSTRRARSEAMMGLPALTTELTETSTKRWAKLNSRCPDPGTRARSRARTSQRGGPARGAPRRGRRRASKIPVEPQATVPSMTAARPAVAPSDPRSRFIAPEILSHPSPAPQTVRHAVRLRAAVPWRGPAWMRTEPQECCACLRSGAFTEAVNGGHAVRSLRW
jgi:hypothetical protein